MEGTLIAHCGAAKITREELQNLSVPEGTGTFKPVPHYEVVDALIETLGFRLPLGELAPRACIALLRALSLVLRREQAFERCARK